MSTEDKIMNHQRDTATYQWTLETYEQRGQLWIRWSTNAPFRAQQDIIRVYENGFPSDPDSTNGRAWEWADSSKSPWNTGLDYGKNWHCARIAQSAPNDKYAYVQKIKTS